eukprot:CAMPEP_0168613106 /NCGR_PEP_ID=MMETSP0449_2-20121227/3277_1 /TAXON_ID=1082188 /ORGANISM="Strombidium rassoulzadegani, Strain ras09" /LENGTH=55 /DNA_ID=CAMNT_0008653723 /DNA_START=259 /DNA_END=426 /DNA_ORIENTATION=-
MIYLTCFIQKCLELVAKNPEKEAAAKALQKLSLESVDSASKPTFFMKGLLKFDSK